MYEQMLRYNSANSDIENCTRPQYFIKLETVPVPNEDTMRRTKNYGFYGSILFGLLLLVNLIILSLKRFDSAPDVCVSWIVSNSTISLYYLFLLLQLGWQARKYTNDQGGDESHKFMQVCKLWIYYGVVCASDYALYVWSWYGVIYLIGGNFCGDKVLQGFVISMVVIEQLYYWFIREKF